MITPPSTSLIFSKNTPLLAFSDQHLDLSLMFPGPGIPRQSGTASEPSDMSFPPSGMSSPRASRRRTPFSLSDLRWKPISLPRDDSQCDCVRAPALVCVFSEVDVAIITLCVWVILFFLLSLFVTLYIFLHLNVMYSSTLGKGWVGRSCLYFLVWVSFGSFSLRELTCMHCVYLALWTRKVLCGSFFYALYINFHSFIHSFIQAST